MHQRREAALDLVQVVGDVIGEIGARAVGFAQRAVRVVAELLRPRTVVFTCIGAGLQLLVVSTIWAWTPSYFNRYYGLAPDQAAIKTGLVVLVGGVGAVGCRTALSDAIRAGGTPGIGPLLA